MKGASTTFDSRWLKLPILVGTEVRAVVSSVNVELGSVVDVFRVDIGAILERFETATNGEVVASRVAVQEDRVREPLGVGGTMREALNEKDELEVALLIRVGETLADREVLSFTELLEERDGVTLFPTDDVTVPLDVRDNEDDLENAGEQE